MQVEQEVTEGTEITKREKEPDAGGPVQFNRRQQTEQSFLCFQRLPLLTPFAPVQTLQVLAKPIQKNLNRS